MAKNSVFNESSRYTQGGATETFKNRHGWWERRNFPHADDDINFTLTLRHTMRPDLVAQEVYGHVNLTWLVLQYNNILDVVTEFKAGTVIKLPAIHRIQSEILTNAPGGK